jgi:hypothetical protein
MDALRRAIAAGMKDFVMMDRDHDLDALCAREDFRTLIREANAVNKSDASPPPKVKNDRK